MLKGYLDDLEERIDEQVENGLYESWLSFCEGRNPAERFMPSRPVKKPSKIEWPGVSMNRGLGDDEAMALQQYGMCSARLHHGSGEILCVRANYGTGIAPSLFGVQVMVMDEQFNTLPASRPLGGGVEAMAKLIARGVPDLRGGYGEKVFAMDRFYRRIADEYPKIGKYVHIYHPDLQGPMDICELLAGSDIFYWFVDEPALVHELLHLITDTYIAFMRQWLALRGCHGGESVHWGWLHKGGVMIRNDSMMNLSPDIYEEFVMPCDQRILDAFGGGAMHFCGRGDHYIGPLSALRGLSAVHMSQPRCNRIDRILGNTVNKGIRLLGYDEREAPGSLDALGDGIGRVHCLPV